MPETPAQRSFKCEHCHHDIFIPYALPPTTAPCPHCQQIITSPALIEKPVVSPFAIDTSSAAVPSSVSPSAVSTSAGSEATRSGADVASGTPSLTHTKSKESATASTARRNITLAVSGAALLIICGVAAWLISLSSRDAQPSATNKDGNADHSALNRAEYLRTGWQIEARKTLEGFLEASTPEQRASYVIGGLETLARLKPLYGDLLMAPCEARVEDFEPVPLAPQDTERMIFMLAYNRDQQFDMQKFFRPIVTVEVQQGVEGLHPLMSSLTDLRRFSMDAMKIQVYFRKTDEGMKLDWDVYLQTRHRRLMKFYRHPQLERPEVFRVVIVEDVPTREQSMANRRVYRIGDPAETEASFRAVVVDDAPVAKDLVNLNWRDAEVEQVPIATATVELCWKGSAENPELHLTRLVCWEFQGIGGGNSQYKIDSVQSPGDVLYEKNRKEEVRKKLDDQEQESKVSPSNNR